MPFTVWIMNHYANHMLFDKGGRHYNFAKYLTRAGCHCVVFCANSDAGHGDSFVKMEDGGLWQELVAEDIDTPFVYVKTREYHGNGKERVLNMTDFYRNVKKAAVQYAEKNGKPDIILASSVHPLTMVAGIQLAKKFGVKCICEVRDLWPEAIVVYSKRLTKESAPAKMMYRGEEWIYKKADAVIYTQEGGPDYVRRQGWDQEHGGPIDMGKLYHINNGVDLEAFEANLKAFPYEDPDLDDPNTYKVVYAGAIRRINNLGIILDTAKLITNKRIRFLIFGDGDELEALKKRVAEEHIDNVCFKGRVNKQYIPSIDARADLNLVHWEMSPLLQVGESYNKSFEYFAAGKPVFYTVRPGYSIVEKYHCGRLTEGFEPKDLAKGIEGMAAMSDAEKAEMARNARKAAEVYDFKNLTAQLMDIMESLGCRLPGRMGGSA